MSDILNGRMFFEGEQNIPLENSMQDETVAVLTAEGLGVRAIEMDVKDGVGLARPLVGWRARTESLTS